MRTLRPWLIAAVAAPLIASLTGCVVVPAHRYRGYDAGYDAGYSSGYDGGGYGYAGGPPQAGYIWIEGVWEVRGGGGRRWVPGHWGPRR